MIRTAGVSGFIFGGACLYCRPMSGTAHIAWDEATAAGMARGAGLLLLSRL